MKHLIMGTAGHVDHGKTALIKALTNVDCDTHKEEKQRGITINLGFTYLDLNQELSIGIIDVPGHKDFIHTMVGGANGIDFVLMVIAADSGIMPQTREHLNILQILGIKRGIIALTKVDLVDDDLCEMARYEINSMLKNTFLETTPIIEVSSITGQGIDELKDEIEKTALQVKGREEGSYFRMYIDRIFSVKGFGNVVTGTVLNGRIDASKTLYLLPGINKKMRIRGIEKHEKPANEVVAGDRAAINLSGLERDDFERGMLISDIPLEDTNIFDANLYLFKNSPKFNIWSTVIIHSGTFESQAKVHLLNKDELNGEENAMVQIHLKKPYVIIRGDRFIIRNTSSDQTLGGGEVIDNKPLHHRRRTRQLIDSMEKISEGSISELIKIEVKKKLLPMLANDVSIMLNRPPDQINDICENHTIEGLNIYKNEDSHIIIEKIKDDYYSNLVIKSLKEFHEKNLFTESGLTADELKGKLGFTNYKTGDLYTYQLLKQMERLELIRRVLNTWIINSHIVKISENDLSKIKWINNIINDYEMQTPLLSEIRPKAQQMNISDKELNHYLNYLVKTGKAYNLDGNYISSNVVNRCRKSLIEELKNRNEGMSVAEFRSLISGNRKITLLLFAKFESEKIIKRSGDIRVLSDKGRNMSL